MRVWLFKAGEPLPLDGAAPRLHRTGLLAQALIDRGAAVTWWTANFDHARKVKRFDTTTAVEPAAGLKLWCLDSRPYARNVSLARIGAHRDMAREFERLAASEPPPDRIVCAYPTAEFCRAAGDYARAHDIHSFVDIRDCWPDIWGEALPKAVRPLAPLLLAPFHRQARQALSRFPAQVSITHAMQRWGARRSGGPAAFAHAFPLAYPAPDATADLTAARRFWAERLPPAELRLCYFGSLSRRTEIGTMIDAVAALPEPMRRRVQLVICGSGEAEAELRERARSLPQVVLPGWIEAPAIRALAEISHAGVLPYPSTLDFKLSIPNKVAEYLSFGLPVLTCLQGPVADLVEREGCGRLYHDAGPNSFEYAVVHLLEPSRRAPMAAAARRVFAERFDAERIYGDYADTVLRGR